MELKYFSNIKLDEKIKSLSANERELLKEILNTIKEIDRRKIFLDYGFPSLFEYLVKSVGYSEGSAQRRIDGARLIRDIPTLSNEIESGALKLSQISLVQQAARQASKTQRRKINSGEKAQLLKQIVNKTHSQSQKEVAAFFNVLPEEKTIRKTQADESVRYQITISKELYEKVKRAQSLLSHSLQSNDLVDYLEYVTEKVIKQKTKTTTSKPESTATLAVSSKGRHESTATLAVSFKGKSDSTAATLDKPILAKLRKVILNSQSKCEYRDLRTMNYCGSTWKLQLDHIKPRWAGGGDDPSNLQVLCAAHNRNRYKVQAQIRAK